MDDLLIALPEKPEKQLKKLVRQRLGGRCTYCGLPFVFLTCDHVIPVSKGGTTTWDNLVPACSQCNISKSDKDVFKWWRKHPGWDPEMEDWLIYEVMGFEDISLLRTG